MFEKSSVHGGDDGFRGASLHPAAWDQTSTSRGVRPINIHVDGDLPARDCASVIVRSAFRSACRNDPSPESSVFVTMNIPLSNKANKADYQRAVNEKSLSESRLNVTRQQIALEVRNSLTLIEQARASIETATIARELAKEQADAEQTRFNLGTSTLRFVLEEQRNMAQAETVELQSLVTFNKALVDLDRAMGLTLTKNNVQVDKAIQGTIATQTLSDKAKAAN